MSNPENNHRMDYIEFGATEVVQTQQFYERTFGWKFTDYGPDYKSFEDGRMTGGFSTEIPKTNNPLVVLYASSLEQTYAQVKANGGRICREIYSFPGGRRFHFVDPGGNELAVWSEDNEQSTL